MDLLDEARRMYVVGEGRIMSVVRARDELRRAMYLEIDQNGHEGIVAHGFLLGLEDGQQRCVGSKFGSRYCLGELLEHFCSIHAEEIEGNGKEELMAGDIVYRTGKTREEYLAEIGRICEEEMGMRLQMTKVEREIVVLRGAWHYVAVDEIAAKEKSVQIYGDRLYRECGPDGGVGDVETFGAWIAGWIKRQVVVEAEAAPAKLSWRRHGPSGRFKSRDAFEEARRLAHEPAEVLQRVEEQTGLRGVEERRVVRRVIVDRL